MRSASYTKLPRIRQGQMCVLEFESVTNDELAVYVAQSLEAVTEAALEHSFYLNWNRVKVKKSQVMAKAT